MNKLQLLTALLLTCIQTQSFAQSEVEKEVPKESLGNLKINFNPSGSKYLQLGIWNQVWLRSIQNNPGTLVNDNPQEQTVDAGIRRFRISATFQLNPRYKIFTQVGTNNQSFISGGGTGSGGNGQGKKGAFFVHDAYNEYYVFQENKSLKNPFSLYMGFGLHAWSGVSRLTNASSSRMLTADLPVFNFVNIEMADQMGRQFGGFVHGEYGKLAYRIAVNKPFATNQKPQINRALDNNQTGKLAFAGYFNYQFLDRESQATSFMIGNYLGEKKVFNIGAGFYTNKEGAASLDADLNLKRHTMTALGLDVFTDLPIGDPQKKMALNIYSVLYNYNYGTNYIRTTGINNPGIADPNFEGITAAEGFGNAKYNYGTGNIWYTQAGFLLPEFSKDFRLQPYVTYALKDLKALNQIGHYYDLGANFLIQDNNAKISLQYGSRPLYEEATQKVFTRRSEILACIQILL